MRPFLLAASVVVGLYAASGTCADQKAKAQALAALLRVPDGVTAMRDLEYVPHGSGRQKLDLYVPESGTNLPLVVWIHGGAWKEGNKNLCAAMPLAVKGYAVASINYRLSQEAPWPAQIEDCKAAIRWLRANAGQYRLNPARIGVWGGSAGGHLVALLGTTGDVKRFDVGENLGISSRVQAVCDWFGPGNLGPWVGEKGMSAQAVVQRFASQTGEADPTKPWCVDAVAQLFGNEPTKEKAADASPVTYVTADDAPFLIMHGDKDNLVPISQSKELETVLKKAGVEANLVAFPGAGHGAPAMISPESLDKITRFFDRHLKSSASR